MRLSSKIVFAGICLCLLSSAFADDWPVVRHDIQNSGFTPQSLRPPLRLRWRVPAYSSALPYLLASDGAVCVGQVPVNMGMKPEVSLFESATGRRIWRLPDALPLYLKGDRLIVGTGNERGAQLCCYSWKKKQLIWSYQLSRDRSDVGRAQYRLAERNGILYLTYNNPSLSSFDFHCTLLRLQLREGRLLTKQTLTDGWGLGPPAVDGKNLYIGYGGWLHILGAERLDRRWGYFDGGNAFPLLVGETVITQGPFHRVRAIQTHARKPMWSHGVWREKAHCLATGPKRKLLLLETESLSSRLVAIEPRSGRIFWRQRDSIRMEGMAAGAGPFVFGAGEVPQQSGRSPRHGFYGWDARTGRLIWRYEYAPSLDRYSTEQKPVIVSEGSLYGLSSTGYLYQFVGS